MNIKFKIETIILPQNLQTYFYTFLQFIPELDMYSLQREKQYYLKIANYYVNRKSLF